MIKANSPLCLQHYDNRAGQGALLHHIPAQSSERALALQPKAVETLLAVETGLTSLHRSLCTLHAGAQLGWASTMKW